jgi:hypothetical protein
MMEDLNFSKYLMQIHKTEKLDLANHFDNLNPKYLLMATALLGTNSLLFACISFYKLGLCFKSLGIFGVLIYVNVCWHWLGYRLTFYNKLQNSNSVVKYWHRKHFQKYFGKVGEINTNKNY